MKFLLLLPVICTVVFSSAQLCAQDTQTFSAKQIRAVQHSGAGASAPGKPVVGVEVGMTNNQQLPGTDTSTNGLTGDLRVHDPVMISENGTYYIFSTGRGISIKTSLDKIHWKNAGRVFDSTALPAWRTKDIPEQDGSFWAPDIHYSNGKYHLFYSVSAWMNFNSSIGYATNTTLNKNDAAYKWIDHGQVISYKNGGEGVNVIDPNIFIGQYNKKYLVYGSYKAGLRLVELDEITGKLKTDPPVITTLTTSLGEGVFIIRGPEYYYIFASRGRCCAGMNSTYQVVMGRSKKLQGPYLNKEGKSWVDNHYSLLLAGDSSAPGKGHNGFFTEGDSTFIVYHAYTRATNGASLLNIQPLYVDAAGWPTMDTTRKLFMRTDQMPKPVKRQKKSIANRNALSYIPTLRFQPLTNIDFTTSCNGVNVCSLSMGDSSGIAM